MQIDSVTACGRDPDTSFLWSRMPDARGFPDPFALLNAQQVRYVLVGGLAVVLHGIDRITADIDLALDLSAESVRDAVSALQGAGFRPMLPVDARQLADPAIRRIWREERGMQVFSFWDPTHSRPSIDIFVESPIAFADLWRDAVEVSLDGVPLRVASVPHLIALKRIAGRPQDLADIEQLLTTDASPNATPSAGAQEPPLLRGTYEDAVTLRRWSFRQRTPTQRLEWLVSMLRIAYQTGALKPREPGSPPRHQG